MIKNIDEVYFCFNTCRYRNYYDGWCHYYDKDADEIDECEYYEVRK